MRRLTQGNAVDRAIADHTRTYPLSKVIIAAVMAAEGLDTWVVQIEAEHFAQPLFYSYLMVEEITQELEVIPGLV